MEPCLEQEGHGGAGSQAVPAPGCATGWRGAATLRPMGFTQTLLPAQGSAAPSQGERRAEPTAREQQQTAAEMLAERQQLHCSLAVRGSPVPPGLSGRLCMCQLSSARAPGLQKSPTAEGQGKKSSPERCLEVPRRRGAGGFRVSQGRHSPGCGRWGAATAQRSSALCSPPSPSQKKGLWPSCGQPLHSL